ncbi:NAD(P)H-binding protein [Rhodocyclus tenuis]|uniref:Uncharacterized protein YbjT (DUF2867 family) n=1 Tax=Rhodocyclus tenuis TaxID=1066 RepID=A0A840FXV7_RHOTE|nr:NAD(P)H-binding protein [Rhodocyclus tenuis]MBB4246957.1 uncharacterized protein YbjT (DUF2867 family) [Rhodocyclus tenuis]
MSLNVLILGAGGQIARVATELFLKTSDAHLTLYLRQAQRLGRANTDRVRVVEGDVLDLPALTAAMADQDVVYANLDGPLEQLALNIVAAMRETAVRRVIFVSSMGIYREVPGEHYRSILDPYRDGAAVIEASGLDYTIIRPAWLNNRDEVAYGTTQKGEAFKAKDETVSRKSVAHLIIKLATTPGLEIGSSLGVHREDN